MGPAPGLFDLKGKVALVTGAGRGLGAAMATALADAGASLVLVGRDPAPLDGIAGAIRAGGGDALTELCDVSQGGQVDAMVRSVGRVDILVNNAGITNRASFTEITEAHWDDMMAVNLRGPFLMSRAILPGMVARGSGKIINIVSVVGELGRPQIAAYATSKGGLKMLTRALATEVAGQNVQVNAIGPGYFITEMNKGLIEDHAYFEDRKARIPAGRWAEPKELAGAVVFLASGASDYVTGQVIFVDGGLTASF